MTTAPPDLHPRADPPAAPAPDPRALTRQVLAALDAAGVTWCLLRGYAGPGGDVDLLVAAADLDRAAAAIRGAGLARLRAYGRGSHRFFLGLDAETASPVELDVVTDLDFGPRMQVRTGAAAGCLARRRRVAGTWVPDPADEFWTLLAHCVLDKGRVPQRYARRLADLAGYASPRDPVARALPADAPAWYAEARAGSWDRLTARRTATLRAARRADPVATARRTFTSTALRRAERLLQGRSRNGVSLALLGPDGSGKSTLADGIADGAWFPVRRVYMGLWGDTERGRLGTAWHLLNRPAALWGRYLVARTDMLLGRLVVFDRYPYDALLPPRGALRGLMRPYLALLRRCCPAPDLVVLLDAPGEVLHARSGEYDPAHLDGEREHYRRHAPRLPHLVVVDADRPADQVRAEVLTLLWRLHRERLDR